MSIKKIDYWKGQAEKIIYTGPIDKYFNYCYGHLGYRSLDYVIEKKSIPDYQGAAVINYPELDSPYIRSYEPKHLFPEFKLDNTVVVKEYPKEDIKNPYYPTNRKEDKELYSKYKELAEKETNTIFIGRLARYKYLDMDDAIDEVFKEFS